MKRLPIMSPTRSRAPSVSSLVEDDLVKVQIQSLRLALVSPENVLEDNLLNTENARKLFFQIKCERSSQTWRAITPVIFIFLKFLGNYF